ncbi:MAG: DUF4442 domain-containing protein [Gammaproteobacteria bacterium]|nr:DUF4442 domain-containing protein [Gammaproteobacteria bacterium]
MSEFLKLYEKIGKEKYGVAVGKQAPYFSTIHPKFIELKPGYCEILIENEKSVHNHLGTIHAIAICNGAELVAGLTTEVSIPDTHRWIPVEMSVKYLGMAKTDIRVRTQCENIDWSELGIIVVPVEALNSHNELIFTAQISMRISKKK